jgi:hypothetical protein
LSDVTAINPTGNIGNTGELVLQVSYPLRASKSSSVSCPLVDLNQPVTEDQDFYIDSGSYPLTTSDATLKTTPIYVRSCRATINDPQAGLNEETIGLLELFPRQAQYFYGVTNPVRTTGDRVRHYENIKVASATRSRSWEHLTFRGLGWARTACIVGVPEHTSLLHLQRVEQQERLHRPALHRQAR